ncbi:MAG: ectoine synthase, partial [Alphaproteobacteria bacterium]|nr:ectoine synthase [Alphaproteobacteria bacterium]
KHILRGGKEDMILACVFNPPVTGNEVHREDGSYAPESEAV